MRHRVASSLFQRYEGNPILTPENWPYPANAVFNPGATEINGETLLLVRVEDLRGFSHLTTARSRDGRTGWQVAEEPTLQPNSHSQEEQWGLEDPRIVLLEEPKEYAVTYVSFSRGGPLVSLATTKDFVTFTKHGALLPPEDKDASLFPRRFGGRFALIHRPIIRGEAHVWISFSPDLKHWGDHQILLPTRPGWWDCHRVGLACQPVETSEGWLILYHGVRTTTAGATYRVGLALLDLEEPWKVIRRSEEWVTGPRAPYERIGHVPDVVFPTGAVLDWKADEFRVYYGAADTAVGLCIAKPDELIEYIKSCPEAT
jgi:predicted GH43/DUF377 family glycosyl hydrolase